jgi:undecaprenyl-diphosphatase
MHGPAELLPVSSSAHTQLVPVLLGWSYPDLPDDARKTFEVALHAGTLIGLLRVVPMPRLSTAVLATAPAAAAGLLWEHEIESRLGSPRSTAVGLIVGSVVMLAADRRAAGSDDTWQPTPAASLAIGIAQAAALVPGLSRLGMSASAARLRGASREQAFSVGRSVGLPVIAGAISLKLARVSRTGIPAELRAPMVAGTLAAAASSLAAGALARRAPVTATAAWRLGLAAAVLRRRDLRQNGRR